MTFKYLLIIALSLFMNNVFAKRVALVMGNDNYLYVSRLAKAKNDADAMAKELKDSGFSVQLYKDVNYKNMVKAVEVFLNSINGGDEVVVFYAGHGVQLKNGSFLLPVDIEAETEGQIEKTSYGLNDLTEKLAETKANFSLIVIDACRDNPVKSKGRSVGNSRGLNAIEPAKGQMIVYSASRGQIALDRLSESDSNPNGVFTREFISRMKKNGAKVEDIVREVQDAVESLAKSVGHEQRPALYNEARGNFYFSNSSKVIATVASNSPDPTPPAAANLISDLVKNANSNIDLLSLYYQSTNEFEKFELTKKLISLNKDRYQAPFYFDRTTASQDNYFLISPMTKFIGNDRVMFTFFTRKIQNFLIFKSKNELVSHAVVDCKNKLAGIHMVVKTENNVQQPPEVLGNPELMRLVPVTPGSIFEHAMKFPCTPYALEPIVTVENLNDAEWTFAFTTDLGNQVFFNKKFVKKHGNFADVPLKTIIKTPIQENFSELPVQYFIQRNRIDCAKKLVSFDNELFSSNLTLLSKSTAYGAAENQIIKDGTTGGLAFDLGCKSG